MNVERVEIFSFHAVGERNGNRFSSSDIALDVWKECAEKLPRVIMGSSLRGDLRSSVYNAISVRTEEGSIRFVFSILSSMWVTLNASGFISDLSAIAKGDVNSVRDPTRTKVLMELDASLRKLGASRVGLSSSAGSVDEFDLLDCNLNTVAEDAVVLDSEDYVLAEMENLGGAKKVNANLRLLDTGEKIVVATDRDFVSTIKENLIFKRVVAHVRYKFNSITKEKFDYSLIALQPSCEGFDPVRFEESLKDYRTGWHDIEDPVAEIRRLRGATNG